jgi:hypothetical protein
MYISAIEHNYPLTFDLTRADTILADYFVTKSCKGVVGTICNHGDLIAYGHWFRYGVGKSLHSRSKMYEDIWTLSSSDALVLLNTIFGKKNTLTILDCSIYELQRLALHAGKSASYYGNYIVLEGNVNVSIDIANVLITPYSKFVYCCEVQDSLLYVRRNGKAFWCGNSRHGQKGVVGAIVPSSTMPFTASGLVPDIIVNPHAIPTRMTIGHLIECLLAKTGAVTGNYIDGTAFENQDVESMASTLTEYGLDKTGDEIMYNGITGEQMNCEIFIGPTYYFRLKHMVDDKVNFRDVGKMVSLTRQPTQGRGNDGGLRIGEMETNVLIAHGISAFAKESMMERSDAYQIKVDVSGKIIPINKGIGINEHHKTANIPYAFKLLMQEAQIMSIDPIIEFETKEHDDYSDFEEIDSEDYDKFD